MFPTNNEGKPIFTLDEDRLSRRKSIVDTVSIQVDILSNSVPSDDVVSHGAFVLEYCFS